MVAVDAFYKNTLRKKANDIYESPHPTKISKKSTLLVAMKKFI